MVLCLGAHFDELQLYIQNLRGKCIKKQIVQNRRVFDLDVGFQRVANVCPETLNAFAIGSASVY